MKPLIFNVNFYEANEFFHGVMRDLGFNKEDLKVSGVAETWIVSCNIQNLQPTEVSRLKAYALAFERWYLHRDR